MLSARCTVVRWVLGVRIPAAHPKCRPDPAGPTRSRVGILGRRLPRSWRCASPTKTSSVIATAQPARRGNVVPAGPGRCAPSCRRRRAGGRRKPGQQTAKRIGRHADFDDIRREIKGSRSTLRRANGTRGGRPAPREGRDTTLKSSQQKQQNRISCVIVTFPAAVRQLMDAVQNASAGVADRRRQKLIQFKTASATLRWGTYKGNPGNWRVRYAHGRGSPITRNKSPPDTARGTEAAMALREERIFCRRRDRISSLMSKIVNGYGA